MFTGIVEEVGFVKSFSLNSNDAEIVVQCKKVLEETKIGDSIAIDGVCQTVTKLSNDSFSAQISAQTLAVTSFSKLKSGSKVNLERALTLSSRLGGHIVSGHVDGGAKLRGVQKLSDFYNLSFEVADDLSKYIVKKGSVTINGISLTVAECSRGGFSIAIIPHTYENTNLSSLNIGDNVNIEVDILAKYVEKFLSTNDNRQINENFLKENGFL